MLYHIRQTVLLAALGAVALTSCRKKEVEELEGPVPTANFTFTPASPIEVAGVTEFPVVVTFTNTSTDAFLSQWDFGDGSPLVSGQTVTHAFALPRTFDVKLTAAGRGGTGTSAVQQVTIPSACGYASFAAITNCGSSGKGSWTYSTQAGAIVTLAANGTTVLSSSPAPLTECQGDDQFIFTSSFRYTYDGQYNCGGNFNSTSGYIFRPNAGNAGLGQIVLPTKTAFIGLIDTTRSKTYDIEEATATVLRLQTTNADGTKTEVTLTPTPPDIVLAQRQLTGPTGSRTWMLDETELSTVTVGTESAPAKDYNSGADHATACQYDDEYTFTATNNFIYDAKATTFVAGDYACEAPRSLTTNYAFGPAVGAGVAQFVLTSPTAFIGTTNSAPDHTYRIISINSRKMVLRAGVTGGTAGQVFTFKLRVK